LRLRGSLGEVLRNAPKAGINQWKPALPEVAC
jgi:hypothetical protein